MMNVQHKFVDIIPETLEDGILYISIEFCTAIHKCICGCGKEVVTPISPTDWQLTFDGKSVSLNPSIGNWNFECKSHYWITNNEGKFARKWEKDEIDFGRKIDSEKKSRYYKKRKKKNQNKSSK
jgi:hypothetical protein